MDPELNLPHSCSQPEASISLDLFPQMQNGALTASTSLTGRDEVS